MKKLLALSLTSALLLGVSMPAHAETITSDQIEWGHLNPLRGDASPRAGKLWGDRTKDEASGFLVKFEEGFSSPPHIHNITYRGVVIKGHLHNDDPKAENMWLPAGSFWVQPAGEAHITAAKDQENMAYIEIDSGPYLVQPTDMAFDNGERPINVDQSNLIWLDASDIEWIDETSKAQRAFLWGNTSPSELNGNLIKLPADFKGSLENQGDIFHAVIISGSAAYQDQGEVVNLEAGTYFGADETDKHQISTEDETIIYIRTNNKFNIYTNRR
ncbi:MAG: hypothetical protein CL561_12805 [Alphaproteobacteria bacterium]|nr:hypothetical protein [Alphaproteobacteria bacterium]|tara:strand:+ start:2985 stop:3800 length:816 start_codon:yes stop_codon:yes gene_type:complete